jgi:hypothetical protein
LAGEGRIGERGLRTVSYFSPFQTEDISNTDDKSV